MRRECIFLLKFRYFARNLEGKPVKGFLNATTKDEAISKLREKKLIIISLEEIKRKTDIVEILGKKKLPVKDLAIFCRQFSTMLSAGLPLLNCLTILKKQIENSQFKKILDMVTETVQKGESLGNAFSQHQEISELVVRMIDVGEVGGVLDEVLSRLATYLEKEYIITEKVKTAMIYPLIVLGVALFSLLLVMIFVIPSFKQILINLDMEMPQLTRILISINDWLINYWYIFIFANICLATGLTSLLQTEKGQIFKDNFLLKIPIFGSLHKKVLISRFTRTLGTLLKSGVPILTALEVVKKVVSNKVVAEKLSQAQVNISNGESMSETLEESTVFTPLLVQMVAIGEETGRLDEMLEKVSDFYDGEVDKMASRLSTLLEPMLIIFLGGIIGTIILAIMLPIFRVIGSI